MYAKWVFSRSSPSASLLPRGTVSDVIHLRNKSEQLLIESDIKTNYVGFHIWDIPKDFNPRPGMNVSLLPSARNSQRLTDKTVELRKSDSLQSSLDRGKAVNLVVPAPTRFALTGGQIPHLELVRRGNHSFYDRSPRRHFSMQSSSIRLRQDDPRRKMHQPRRILRLNRSAKPLHRYNGPLNPGHNHCAPSNAPPTQDCRVYHPMPRRSVSKLPKSNPNHPSYTAHSNLTHPTNRATAVGVWRIVMLAQAFLSNTPNPDPTYAIGFCSSAVEINVAVVSACGPSLKAISSRIFPKLLGSSRGKSTYYGAGTGSGTGVGSRRLRSNAFKSTSHAQQSVYSTRGADYEMADPLGGPPVDVVGDFEMRKYKRGGSDSGLSSEDGKGIMKTTDISVGYSMEPRVEDGRSHDGRPASVDSIV